MKKLINLVKCIALYGLLVLCTIPILVHGQINPAVQTKGNVYAIVIGISTYQDEGIDQLNFAHKDAESFAAYLSSASGGLVPDSNIILLKNESATYTAVYQAFDQLVEKCKEGDLVYFFFSGHGDMENTTIFKLGFLISHNTPKTNFINNAIRIDDINNYANTLSIKTKAKVVIITDACHSGNIADKQSRASFLIGEQLKTVLNNEIRITSCTPDQLSVEDQKWGGGSGVFTYYLLKGLKGFADQEKDGNVTVKELSTYLNTALSNDFVLKAKDHKQTPVIKGKDNFSLAKVNAAELNKLQQDSIPRVLQFMPLPKDLNAYFFEKIDKNIEKSFNFNKLHLLPAQEIPFAMFKDYDFYIKSSYDSTWRAKISELENDLKSNPDAVKRFNRKLVNLISTRGQEVINLYLNGNAEELERRRYYNSLDNDYGEYTHMFAVAIKLCDEKSPLAKMLQIKYHYFNGVNTRLQLPIAKDTTGLIDSAFRCQQRALKLEENAAYIHAELGILYYLKGNFTSAEQSLKLAIDIAPTWAIPWSTLAALYIQKKQYKEALEATEKAKALQPDLQAVNVNAGIIYMKLGNWLMSEELLQKAIYVNSRHYLPFEKLADIYTHHTQYVLADSFYYEAEIRKLGYNVGPNIAPLFPFDETTIVSPPAPDCDIPKKIANYDYVTYFVKGMQLLRKRDTIGAEKAFRYVIEIDIENPLAYHYLGMIMWHQHRWQEVDIYLNFAIKYHLDDMAFETYCDDALRFLKGNPSAESCIFLSFKNSNYNTLDDYFLLADAYEKLSQFSEAELLYKKAIQIDTAYQGSYQKLWILQERLGKYHDAEPVVLEYKKRFYSTSKTDFLDGLEQANAFYKRATEAMPDEATWFYRAGNYHYAEAIDNPEMYSKEMNPNKPDQDIKRDYSMNQDGLFSHEMKVSTKKLIIPSTQFILPSGIDIPYPKSKSIEFFKQADSLLHNQELSSVGLNQRGDINEKIGDMYVAMANTRKGFVYYEKSVLYRGNHTSTRLKLIDTWNQNYHFQEAKKQLDTLYSQGTINYDKLLLLAKYRIQSSEFDSVKKILDRAQTIQPFSMPAIDELNGRLNFCAQKYKSALPYYETYLKSNFDDASIMYTIAKIHYQLGHHKESLTWLSKAVNAGFACYWVLKYDTVWNKERDTSSWKKITENIKPKPFPIKFE
ncbi:MAG: caspase family protein [Chitinophagaceae bacterium]|nr:caspase family protein [Chitinophagaceae bacterium]